MFPALMEDYSQMVKALYEKEADCTEHGLIEGLARLEWKDFKEGTGGEKYGAVGLGVPEATELFAAAGDADALLEMCEGLDFLAVRAACNEEETRHPGEKYTYRQCRQLYSSLSAKLLERAGELMGE